VQHLIQQPKRRWPSRSSKAAAEPLVVKAHDPHDILMCVICMSRLASRVSLQSGMAAIDNSSCPIWLGNFCWIVPQQIVLHWPIPPAQRTCVLRKVSAQLCMARVCMFRIAISMACCDFCQKGMDRQTQPCGYRPEMRLRKAALCRFARLGTRHRQRVRWSNKPDSCLARKRNSAEVWNRPGENGCKRYCAIYLLTTRHLPQILWMTPSFQKVFLPEGLVAGGGWINRNHRLRYTVNISQNK